MARSTPQLLSLLSPRVPHQLSLDAGLVFYVIVAEKVFEKEIGPVAQLVERAHGMGEARGSKPLGSTCG